MDQQTGTRDFTILLVDDRVENLVSLEGILANDNRKFLTATSGNEALKIALKNEEVGLIMLDVQMPDMDGFEVARFLKSNKKTKDINIIFVTAINKEEHYVMQGFEEGAVDYLQKPLDINVTKAKVNVFEKLYFSQLDLKNSLTEIERINKQLDRFVYIVSHDLKSPLSSVITMLSILKNNEIIKSNDYLQDSIDIVYMGTHELADMISSILEYSRQSYEQQTIEETDTQELVQHLVFLLMPPPNIEVIVDDSLPVMQTRKQKLKQVFQNLISNAIKYSNKEKGLIEIGAKDKGTFVEFFVKDNGPGISRQDEQRIFKLFEVTENRSNKDSSTGVGLNLLKILVEEQGGKIWVESEPGKGSIFYFEWNKS